MPRTHEEAVLSGRLGGLSRAARADAAEQEAYARARFMKRFLLEADPELELTLKERTRRAELLKRAYFTRLALRSVKSRRRKAEKLAAEQAAQEPAA